MRRRNLISCIVRSCLLFTVLALAGFDVFHQEADASSEGIPLSPGIRVYIDPAEPEALQLAVKDLLRDMEKVLGQPSERIHRLPDSGPEPIIAVFGPSASQQPGHAKWVTAAEAHRVFIESMPNGASAIVCQGADLRGAMYAVYTLSEEILGVPPLWVWSSWKPKIREEITIPANTDILYESPYVRWRAWFPNDMDYLTPWLKGNGDPELVAETMLRLKLNLWDTGSVLNETMAELTSEAATASKRGIVSCSTHTSPLGARLTDKNWEIFWTEIQKTNDLPPMTDKAALMTYWEQAVQRVKELGVETLWTLTFRGAGDVAFWQMIEGSPDTDRERAAVISDYVKLQRDLVLEHIGPNAVMRVPMYNEMSDYMIAGLLDPPPGDNIIWNFVAARRDHYPPIGIENITLPTGQPIGLYFNYQFTSTGSHVVQGEGPWKMEDNFRFIDGLQPEPLRFAIVNAGNIREFPLELSANAHMMWDFESYDSDTFLQTYCRTYFGEDHAVAVAGLYRDFYNAYWEQHPPTRPGFARQFIFQDLRYARALRELITELKNGTANTNPFSGRESFFMIDPSHCGAETPLDALILGAEQSGSAFSKVAADCDRLLPYVAAEKRIFYNNSLRVPAHFMALINQTTLEAARAVKASPGSRKRKDGVQRALQHFRQARELLKETEHGRFDPWYPQAEMNDVFRFDEIESELARLVGR